MCNVLVEGGGGLLGAFFDQRLADELVVFIAHRLIGGAAAPGPLGGRGVRSIARAVRPVFPPELRRLGPDLTCQLLLTDPTRLLD
ncbi:MAG: dihydrofolate reductase family protein [Phycisphaerae bacterium]